MGAAILLVLTAPPIAHAAESISSSAAEIAVKDSKSIAGLDKSDAASIDIPSNYLVLVYISGSKVIAKDSNGDVIASGEAGIDDTAVIRSAIESQVSGNILLIGMFHIDSTIHNLKSGMHLSGITDETVFDCSDISQSVFLVGDNGYAKSMTPLSDDVSSGSMKIAVEDAKGYDKGDYVKLIDDYDIVGFKKGEILRISKIKGNEITFQSPISDSYSADSNASIRKLEMIDDISIDGITFIGPGMETDLALFDGYLLKNFAFRNNDVRSFGRVGVSLIDSLDCTIEDNSMHDVYMKGFGYSIGLANACRNISIISNSFKQKGRHFIAIGGSTGTRLSGGFSRDINIINNDFQNCTQEAVNTHEPFMGPINITGNKFVNCDKGVEISNGNTNIWLNSFESCGIGIQLLGDEERDHNIHSNSFNDCLINIDIRTGETTLSGNLEGGRIHIKKNSIKFM